MFSLIITIISIALVAGLTLATAYYGGSAFQQGSARANASTLVAQAQQITGANTLRANDNGGVFATSVSDLVSGNYLSAIPRPATSVSIDNYAVDASNRVTLELANDALKVAEQVNKSVGAGEIVIEAELPTDQAEWDALPQYGVIDTNGEDTEGGLVFFYKG